MPHLVRFDRELRDRGLTVIGLHDPVKDEEGLASVRTSLEKSRIGFPVLLSDEATREDYGVTGIPTRVLVDRAGRVVFRESGFSEEMTPALEGRLQEALK